MIAFIFLDFKLDLQPFYQSRHFVFLPPFSSFSPFPYLHLCLSLSPLLYVFVVYDHHVKLTGFYASVCYAYGYDWTGCICLRLNIFCLGSCCDYHDGGFQTGGVPQNGRGNGYGNGADPVGMDVVEKTIPL